MKEKIKELLGLNLPNKTVASAVGVDESYISQLLSDEVFAGEVQELRVKTLAEHANRDKAYNALEDALLKKVDDLLPMMVRPMEVVRALQVVNNATRRAAPAELSATAQPSVVVLQLPNAIINKFVVNAQKQIVEVEGETISTMSAKGVLEKLERSHIQAKEPVNAAIHEDDKADAVKRLRSLVALEHLPLASLV